MTVTHEQLDELRKELVQVLDGKVGYRHFYWVVGTMILVISSILAFQINLIIRVDDKVERISGKTGEIAEDVAEINGQLKGWEVVK